MLESWQLLGILRHPAYARLVLTLGLAPIIVNFMTTLCDLRQYGRQCNVVTGRFGEVAFSVLLCLLSDARALPQNSRLFYTETGGYRYFCY